MNLFRRLVSSFFPSPSKPLPKANPIPLPRRRVLSVVSPQHTRQPLNTVYCGGAKEIARRKKQIEHGHIEVSQKGHRIPGVLVS